MKDLIMIAGPAGVGKTTVCRALFRSVSGSAWLDGDWCWMVNPYPGKTDEQKRYVEKAFGYLLDGYLNDPHTQYIFFSWLMHSDFMFPLVTDQITSINYRLHKFVLVCDDRETYRSRMIMDARRQEQLDAAVDMNAYRAMHAEAIDVSRKSPLQVAQEIMEKVMKGGAT